MKICVYGLSHLGIVTAACLGGGGFCTTGIDDDSKTVAALRRGEPPLFEPGLAELLHDAMVGGTLSFSGAYDAVAEADLVWIAFDTPVDEGDQGDTAFVMDRVAGLFPSLRDGAVVLVSSQLPVGSVAALERRFAAVAGDRRVSFACSPENLRLGRALADFTAPARAVVGVRDDTARAVLGQVLGRFSANLLWMSVESAEMSKHALNAFLATSIAFTNELASICERVGADAADIERALRSEPRVGAKAYVRAGPAFFGGTLGRDLAYLSQLAEEQQVPAPLLGSVIISNSGHRLWPVRQLERRLGDAAGCTVAVFGLAYKPGTDSTRRSPGVAVCRWLIAHAATVRVVDPRVRTLPDDLRGAVQVHDSADTALEGADALVVATEWPEFTTLSADTLRRAMRTPLVIDQSHHLSAVFAGEPRVTYVTPGKPS